MDYVYPVGTQALTVQSAAVFCNVVSGSVVTGGHMPRQHRGPWGWDACRGHGRDGRRERS